MEACMSGADASAEMIFMPFCKIFCIIARFLLETGPSCQHRSLVSFHGHWPITARGRGDHHHRF